MRALAPVLALSAVLAGCVLPVDPAGSDAAATAARLACFGEVCNFEATVEDEGRQANELSLSVNPTNPLNIVATGKDYTPEYAGDCVWDGIYATHDGGQTWINQNLPGSPWKRLADASEPETPFSRFWCATDPVVEFGPDGTLYWTVMPYQCDPASGSKLGRDVIPGGLPVPVTGGGGGLNDWFWTCSSMYVLVSDDGGATFPLEKVREVAFGERLVHDRQWIGVAPDGNRVLLCWRYGGERALAAGILPAGGDAIGGPAALVCSVSEDKGDTWSAPKAVGGRFVSSPVLDFGPDGTAWITGQSDGEVVVLSSADGYEWTEPVAVASYEMPPPGGEHGRPVLAGSEFRISAWPHLAVDRSDGPHAGRVYVTWFDHSAGNGNALLSWSDDGVVWSPPAQVHDDGESAHDQFAPTVSVGPDGIVDVSWWDRRDDPDNHLFHVYYTYSTDGGVTWAPNVRVTDVASDEQYSRHQNGMIFLGDYRDAASSEGAAHVVWVDTRNEVADVFVATVLRP